MPPGVTLPCLQESPYHASPTKLAEVWWGRPYKQQPKDSNARVEWWQVKVATAWP